MANDPKKDKAVSSNEKVPRQAWKITLTVFAVLGLIIAGSWLWSNWSKSESSPAKVIAPTTTHLEKTTGKAIPTGITLQPGEKIVGTKDPDALPVELVVRFPDGETVIINSKHWTSRNIELTHIGHNVRGRPGEILYRGERQKYQWQKVFHKSEPAIFLNPETPRVVTPAVPCPFE